VGGEGERHKVNSSKLSEVVGGARQNVEGGVAKSRTEELVETKQEEELKTKKGKVNNDQF